ncbi:MAG: hypothetical protein CME71_11790 [Halobacteriovorax sp.]|nr:hypothetical protein [Halobacteriovorax sp.]|tara:strand:- start:821 stop:1111 length:291 start_codon:yes stop_codon:yes gene_type:complete
MGGLFGGSKDDSGAAAIRAENERLRKEADALKAETKKKEDDAAEKRRLKMSGMYGTGMLMEEDETGFLRKKKATGSATTGYGSSTTTSTPDPGIAS